MRLQVAIRALAVAGACLISLGCQEPSREAGATAAVAATPKGATAPRTETEMQEFECTWHRENHDVGETGFNLPDAAFALTVPEDSRMQYRALHNEDTLVIGDAHFVRGWAPLPVNGLPQTWGIGFWIKISASDYAEFERLSPGAHPNYRGTIANQSLHGRPTLGLAAEMVYRPHDVGGGTTTKLRPEIRFLGDHPLTRFQASGLPADTWRTWVSDLIHEGDPQPGGEPFEAELDQHGWSIHEPDDAGKEPVQFAAPPKVGDTVKAVFGVLASDASGEPTQINAGWWIALDDVARPDRWSGTLSNPTRVPATITVGSRIWVKPGQVIEHAPAQPGG